MTAMTRTSALLSLLLPLMLCAQTEVRNVSWSYSTGVASAFSATFTGTDAKRVESFYKARLKDISADVSNKKEVVAVGTRILDISGDTLRVLVKADKPKRSEETTVYVAFLLAGRATGPDSDQQQIQGCRDWVYRTAVTLKKELAQEALDAATKHQKDLENALAMLVREKDRAQGSIEKTQDRIVKDEQEKSAVEGERTTLDTRVQAKQTEVSTSPSEANTKELQTLLKEQEKLKRRSENLTKDIEGGRKKIEDLKFAIKKNLQDQEAKGREIAAQKLVVEQLAAKLAGIN